MVSFLPDFNGVALYDHKKVAFQVHLDACLQGLGCVFHKLVYHVPIPLGFCNLTIVQLEVINILVPLNCFAIIGQNNMLNYIVTTVLRYRFHNLVIIPGIHI